MARSLMPCWSALKGSTLLEHVHNTKWKTVAILLPVNTKILVPCTSMFSTELPQASKSRVPLEDVVISGLDHRCCGPKVMWFGLFRHFDNTKAEPRQTKPLNRSLCTFTSVHFHTVCSQVQMTTEKSLHWIIVLQDLSWLVLVICSGTEKIEKTKFVRLSVKKC